MSAAMFPRQIQLLLLAVVFMASGCQQMLKLNSGFGRTAPEASASHPVFEVICLWEPGEGNGLDGLPTRGFVGQVMFFAHGIDVPVRVDGDLMVYVFDDVGTEEEQQKPIHQFEFNSVAMKAFLTETNVGTAYQFFIPYTRKGSHKTTCSLRVRLTPKTGNPVYSKMSSIVLAGKTPRKPDVTLHQPNQSQNEGVQLATHEVVAASQPAIHTVSSAVQSNDADKMLLKSKLSQLTHPATPSAGVKTLPATSGSGTAEAGPRAVPNATASGNVNPLATVVPVNEQTPKAAASSGSHVLLDGANPVAAETPSAVPSGGMRLKPVVSSVPAATPEKAVPKAFPVTSEASAEVPATVSKESHPIEGETPVKQAVTEAHPLLD